MNHTQKYPKLEKTFYLGQNVVELSRALIGKVLVSRFNGEITAGLIVETEAYAGAEDRASHAYGGRRTARTEIMFAEGGTSYVYLCYGIHRLFNVITNHRDVPHAILIRGLEPIDGIDIMLKRRGVQAVKRNLTGGPGLVAQALGITLAHNGLDLCGDKLWIEDRNYPLKQGQIVGSPRVGVGYAGEDAYKPWRFRLKDNPFTSPAR